METAETGRLARWSDAVLGELTWSERTMEWCGVVRLEGRDVELVIDPGGLVDPTREEQVGVLEPSRRQLLRLPEVLAELRSRGVAAIVEAVGEHARRDAAAFEASLELFRVSLNGAGRLRYRSESFFPKMTIDVCFDADVRFEGAEVY